MAAITAGFTVYIATAAERIEHVPPQTEFSKPATDPSSSVETEAALARVNAARSRADADPLALEDALTALGDALLKAGQYASAEAAYAEALRRAEQHGGPDSERVLAPLLGLGNTFAGSGHHQEAVVLLQRAVAITRAQHGLFDRGQQDTLKTLAGSLTTLGRLREAQDLMIYRVRIAEKVYHEGSPKVIPVLCELGDWFAEVGRSVEARMTFQVALNIVGATPSLNAPIIVEPLRGIARTYMRRQSYPETWLTASNSPARWARRSRAIVVDPAPADCSAPGQECRPPSRTDSGGKPIVGTRELNREGEYALQKALRILEGDPSASTQTRIETLIQMGDWYQIKKSPREALLYYQRAWQLIRTASSLPSSATTALNVPLRVYYPTPEIVAHAPAVPGEETRSNYVQIEFTVAADGSVQDARIVDHDTRERYARDIFDAIRASRFRPKFVDGQAVATPGITYREVFWTSKPRE
ncbi:MAG TPA: tetratricopeptide repeat protein [Steroidobacteraceae bacterium]